MAKIIQDSSDIIRKLQPNNVDLQLKLSNNVKNKFEYLEKALPHEDATGTGITMNNTAEYYIRTHNIKGDSSQVTTTGKNLFDINSAIGRGLSRSGNEYTLDGSIDRFSSQVTDVNIPAGTYHFDFDLISGTYNQLRGVFYCGNDAFYLDNNNNITVSSAITKYQIYVTTTSSVVKFKNPQLESGTTKTSYEPFTGGNPGPNPDYPEDIEVVKGKNLLNINRELGTPSNTTLANTTPRTFDLTKLVKGLSYNNYYNTVTVNSYSINGNSLTVNNKNIYGIGFPLLLQSGSYTLSYSSVSISDVYIALYKTDGTSLTGYYRQNIAAGKVSYTFTIDSELVVVPIFASHTPDTDITFTNIQLEKGSTATGYLPYKSIGVNVASKNLFILPDNITQNGITYQKNEDGTFNISGTATANTNIYIPIDLINTNINNGTYTISKKSAGYNTQIDLYNNSTWVATPIYVYGNNLNSTATITIPSNTTKIRFIIYVANGNSINLTNEHIQLEKNSTATEYVPYHSDVYPLYLGDTELCKIDGYQDRFKKSTGKNLFSSEIELGSISGTGQKTDSTTQCRTKDHISIKPNTQYSLWNNQSQTYNLYFYDENKTYLSYSYVSGNTFTSPANAKYAMFLFGSVVLNILVMLNEGSTALPYEPYGVGVWYLHKEIGKVVLNGSESWNKLTYSGDSGGSIYWTAIDDCEIIPVSRTDYKYSFCSHFTNVYMVWGYTTSKIGTYSDHGTANAKYFLTNFATKELFQTWLASNNVELYYVLNTPTNTVVTDETLLQQLQDLDNAVSYEGTTYLTTLGNLPPIVDITYTQDIKKLIAAATQS